MKKLIFAIFLLGLWCNSIAIRLIILELAVRTKEPITKDECGKLCSFITIFKLHQKVAT
jgi:hypothetical protein